jgi:L,D-peptidoglycan transpeptidase YkuD (ErfK/YbiS/YcfS/YnhG family)
MKSPQQDGVSAGKRLTYSRRMDLMVSYSETGPVVDWGAGPRRCAIGPAGIAVKQAEGDGVTPLGVFALREVFYRPDRVKSLQTSLPLRRLDPGDGWCDAPGDPRYNRLVKLPYPASAESLWRADSLYDIIAVIGFNDDPVHAGKGSAIFLHLARSVGDSRSDHKKEPDYAPTQGCVALAREDLIAALEQFQPGDKVRIG